MNIQGFRAAADRPNAIVEVDLKSAQVKVRDNHVFNRAITWLRRRFSPSSSRDTATGAVHNRFLQAIADRRSGYDSGDVNRARELLADDVLERKPLSSRRIREVLDDLDGRSSATTRINRRVAAYFHDEVGITNTLAARDLAADSRDEQADDAEPMDSGEAGAAAPGLADEPPSLADDPPVSATTSESGTAREEVVAETLIHPSSVEALKAPPYPKPQRRPPRAPSERPNCTLRKAKSERRLDKVQSRNT